MSDPANPTADTPPPPRPSVVHPHFPLARVLYAIGFAFVAWFVVHVLFFLAVVQVALLAINGQANDELKRFCLSLVAYVSELFAYITFARDEQPFPLGPFPKHA
jgi:hypothetical protein